MKCAAVRWLGFRASDGSLGCSYDNNCHQLSGGGSGRDRPGVELRVGRECIGSSIGFGIGLRGRRVVALRGGRVPGIARAGGMLGVPHGVPRRSAPRNAGRWECWDVSPGTAWKNLAVRTVDSYRIQACEHDLGSSLLRAGFASHVLRKAFEKLLGRPFVHAPPSLVAA